MRKLPGYVSGSFFYCIYAGYGKSRPFWPGYFLRTCRCWRSGLFLCTSVYNLFHFFEMFFLALQQFELCFAALPVVLG